MNAIFLSFLLFPFVAGFIVLGVGILVSHRIPDNDETVATEAAVEPEKEAPKIASATSFRHA